MQLMWVSGPTASVRTISITAKKVLVAVCASAFVLVTLGVLLHFIGFRIAIEMSPSLARSMGGARRGVIPRLALKSDGSSGLAEAV